MDSRLAFARDIFLDAVAISDLEDRAAFLDRACAGGGELRGRVEALIEAHERTGGLLQDVTVVGPAVASALGSSPDDNLVGTSIGPYKLLEVIGEGGMGTVYMVEQTEPILRRMALKVIKLGMDSRQVVARFEVERQALALMDHPNIAKVHDAGMTPTGRPYFAMELVRGLSITEYCDREELSIDERLGLFVLVCRAVQHAHQKGIIHRDLKPSNVLVTVIDGVAIPKVIDFGVAKATGSSLTDKTLFTGFHQFVGTPLYVSPEQADLAGADIDTRSDIYSLGVLLYELLTGTTPFDSATLKWAAFDEMRRIIREEEPPRPSTRLSSLGERLSTVSARRKSDPRRLGSALKGELDWVVMKALEKDRGRRYETANAFAADVMNYLADRPVEACPPSGWYRSAKYARRHRAALTTAVLVTLALVTGTAVSLWQAVQARRAGAEARRHASESRHVVDFLVKDVFGSVAPEKIRERARQGRGVTLLDLLNDADSNLSERFADQPLVEASIRMALAETYRTVWDRERMETNAARAADLRERWLGPDDLETLEAIEYQAEALIGQLPMDKVRVAEPLARRAFLGRRRQLGAGHPDTLLSECHLGMSLAYIGRASEGLPLLIEAAEIARRENGPDSQIALRADEILGVALSRSGDPGRGEAVLRRVVVDSDRILGPLHVTSVGRLNFLAGVSLVCGHLAEARMTLQDALRRGIHVFGPDHVQISAILGYLNQVLIRQGDFIALRDLHQGLLRDLLTTPIEPGQFMRDRRDIRLMSCLKSLATLPDVVPVDQDLVVRAAEEVGRLRDGKAPGVTLALLFDRAGRAELALESLGKMKARPDWAKIEDDYSRLVEARILARRGELAEARRLYERTSPRLDSLANGQAEYEGLRSSVEALFAGNDPTAGRPERPLLEEDTPR